MTALVFLLLGGVILMMRLLPFAAKVHLTHVVLLLRNGESYSRALEEITRTGQFETPEGRNNTLAALVALLRPDDIMEGFVVSREGDSTPHFAVAAQILAQQQLTIAETRPRIPNVTEPPIISHPDAQNDNFCVVGLVLVASQAPLRGGDFTSTQVSLTALNSLSPQALHFFYTPRPGKRLSRSAAFSLLQYLRGESTSA